MMFSMRTIWLKISTLQSDDHPQPHRCGLHSPMQTMWDEAMPRLSFGHGSCCYGQWTPLLYSARHAKAQGSQWLI